MGVVVYLVVERGLEFVGEAFVNTADGITHREFLSPERAEAHGAELATAGALSRWEVVARPLFGGGRAGSVIYLVAMVYWRNPAFARNPAGGVPLAVATDREPAEATCLALNREFQEGRSPFDYPPREVASLNSAAWIRWAEDEPRLRVLNDYVQDLGLDAPAGDSQFLRTWRAWWQATRPAMEPAQWQAIWTFLDRLLPYRVSEVPCEK